MSGTEADSTTGTGTQCGCYECIGPRYESDEQGRRFVANNCKHHTEFEPCAECGRPKTEYRDFGRKGYFVCWWCNHRSVSPDVLPPSETVGQREGAAA
jgi:hypothetical protein